MAEKPVKAKEPVKVKSAAVEKSKPAKPALAKTASEKAVAAPAKAADKGKEKSQPKQPSKQPGRIARWWRETIGELRKVSWPTVPEARRMTGIVLVVMAATALVLGLLDFIFSQFIGLLAAL